MLGKLIKHEWKAVAKVLAIIHIALILMAMVGKIMLSIDALEEAWPMWSALLFVYVLSVIAVGVGTQIYLAMRFYKNMYTDEGYLSFTLPVKPWEHIFSKTLVASIWIVIDVVVIVASIIILVMYRGMGNEFLKGWNEFMSEVGIYGIHGVWTIIQMIVMTVVAIISVPLTYYFSISIGQLFNTHKMLASVVVFFIVTNVSQVLSTIISTTFMIKPLYANAEAENVSVGLDLYNSLLNAGMIEQVVFAVAFALITNYIMNRKLNLE